MMDMIFCAQMGLEHMRAYSSMAGQRPLWTPIDLAVIDLLGIAHVNLQRFHYSRYCCLLGLRDG